LVASIGTGKGRDAEGAKEVEEGKREMTTEDVGLPSVDSPLGEQLLEVIDAYTLSHPEISDDEMTEHIDRALREVKAMCDFVGSMKGVTRIKGDAK
jgi:hypothetical protein